MFYRTPTLVAPKVPVGPGILSILWKWIKKPFQWTLYQWQYKREGIYDLLVVLFALACFLVVCYGLTVVIANNDTESDGISHHDHHHHFSHSHHIHHFHHHH